VSFVLFVVCFFVLCRERLQGILSGPNVSHAVELTLVGTTQRPTPLLMNDAGDFGAVTLTGLTITGGDVSGNGGGIIYEDKGDLTK